MRAGTGDDSPHAHLCRPSPMCARGGASQDVKTEEFGYMVNVEMS